MKNEQKRITRVADVTGSFRRLTAGHRPFLAVLLLAGCSTTDLGTGGPAAVDVTCSSCHGTGEDGAPPPGVGGSSVTSDPGVGAHETHLKGGTLGRKVECGECHAVPATVDAPGHADGKVDLAWGALARTGGAAPAFDGATATCSSVYCHGSTLAGGTIKAPIWTRVDGTQAKCGTCHGVPPASPHPQNESCKLCHPDPEKGGKHINGVLEMNFEEMTCTSCHGNPDTGTASPPLGTKGEDKTSQAAVGAHEKHLGASDWHRAGVCRDCHVVPTSMSHADGDVDLAFGDVAKAGGSAPEFDFSKTTCSSVYCHGTTLLGAKTGGSVKREPVWTQVDGTFKACGASCHTNPPGGDHPDNDKCDLCHGQVIGLNGQFTNPALHVDGKVDVKSMACNACHGSDENNAPPVSTTGSGATSDVTVGAHQSHVKDGDLRKAMDCGECHVVPADADAPGHIDTPPAEITWGALSKTGGADPAWDRNAATCSAVYCHGSTLSGGTKTEPVWTTVDGSFSECGSCHGAPPPWPHTFKSTCNDCHSGTVASGGTVDVAGGMHVNGQLEIDTASLTCSSCHGGAENPAPPVGTRGETQTTEAAVGAHQQHLTQAAWHRNVQCDDCHVVPQGVDHSDGQVEVPFGTIAKSDLANPSFDPAALTCSNVYCHGTTLKGPGTGGTVNRTPEWTKVDGTYNACGTTCHTNPPGQGHPTSTSCQSCHPSTISVFNPGAPVPATWKDPQLHINGKVNF